MNRIALIIGNEEYKSKKLKNPVNDAEAMNKILSEMGVKTSLYVNQTSALMKETIDTFCGNLELYDVVMFYYSGHGIQIGGRNYLIPVDVQLDNETQVEYDCVRIDRFIDYMQYYKTPKTCIIILDACRDNPFKFSMSRSMKTKGLAPMIVPSGTFLAYSTSPDKTASDGMDDNGLYTKYLLKHINTPNLKIETIFKRIREDVKLESNMEISFLWRG